MHKKTISQTVEDYLKTIYELRRERNLETVPTTLLAGQMQVTPASVTGMIKRLAEMRLVVYEPYRGAKLTPAGQKIALQMLRHHRLIELFLAETLRVPWDRVHEEAHKIEHVLSQDLEERIDTLLGHPTTDPHGAPIPGRDGKIAVSSLTCLAELKTGQSAMVAEVSDDDSALLRYLDEIGLHPDTRVTIVTTGPLNDLFVICVGAAQYTLSYAAAKRIFVTYI